MRIKLILILFLAVSAVAAVGYVSYMGLANLMTTLEQTVQPDYREEELHTLLYHISEAENSVRIYTITRESRYLRPYYSNIRHADTLIQNLQKKSKKDLYLVHHFDTIDQYLSNKTNIQNRLIRLKQDQNRIDVYEEVLTKIQSLERKNAVIDSLKNAVEKAEQTLEKEIQAKEKEIDVQENVPEQERPGFFKRLFSPGKKTEEEQLVQEQDILKKSQELDTLLAAKDTLINIIDTLVKENITAQIEQTLAEIKIREDKINQELTIIELALTRRDKAIGFKIQEQVDLVQKYFDQLDIRKANEASNFFNKITDQITIIGSISSMLFLVLVFVVMNDIKTNQRYRKRLEDAKLKAEKLAQAKDEFLSNMSHEIRTPMNAILGFAELLNSADLNEQNRKQLNIIQNASRHLLAIINDILDYAKIEAGKIKMDQIPFSLEENARIVYDTLYKNARDKDIEFTLDIGDKISRKSIIGDPVRFRQIIFNLADNAIKFTENGVVKISIDLDDQHIIIKVKDTGVGIDKAHLHQIFRKFDQATTTTSKKYGGTGLGLAIVKKLIDMQNGLITVHSEIDKGTEFTMKLPYVPASDLLPEDSIEMVEPELIFPENRKVLIVDDEEYNLLLIESILDKYNISYKSAHSGYEAAEIFQSDTFHLLLLDLQMNDLDGFAVTKIIREQYQSSIPVVATTATATGEIRTKCLEAGMNDVLIKPISEKDVIQCLKIYFLPDRSSIHEMNAVSPNSSDQDKGNNANELKAIFDLFQHDHALALSMTNIYMKNLTSVIKNFEINHGSSDMETISKTAHKIIPSTRHMGFNRLADQLKQLELHIINKKEIKIIEEQLYHILAEGNEIISQLKKLLESMKDIMKH